MKTREDENDNNLKITYTIKPSFTTRKLEQLQQENKELENKIKRLEEIIQWYEKENRHNQEFIIDLSKRIDKTTQAIDELLSYDDFKDITNANFGNVKEELKFYLSNYKTLEDFRKEIINNEK